MIGIVSVQVLCYRTTSVIEADIPVIHHFRDDKQMFNIKHLPDKLFLLCDRFDGIYNFVPDITQHCRLF